MYKILNRYACMIYGSGTKWCITEKDSKHFDNYSLKGDFYFYISKTRSSDDPWYKIAYLSVVNKYWDATDKEYSKLPASLGVPKFKVDAFEERIVIEGKVYTLPEFHALKELDVKGDLDLSDTKITSLPDNLKVGGGLDLSDTKITSLPDNLEVGWNLDLRGTKITSLPDNLEVGGDLKIK